MCTSLLVRYRHLSKVLTKHEFEDIMAEYPLPQMYYKKWEQDHYQLLVDIFGEKEIITLHLDEIQ